MKNAAIVIATLVVAALVVAGLWVLGSQMLAWFLGLKAGAMTALSTVAVGLAVAVTTGVITRRNERKRLLEEPVRVRKTDFYDTLIKDLMKMFNLGNPGAGADAAAIQEMFERTPAPMLTFASRGVIVAWNELRQASFAMAAASAAVKAASAAGATLVSPAEPDPKFLMERIENLLKAVRKDLGHTVWLHQSGELASVWINDAADYFKRKR